MEAQSISIPSAALRNWHVRNVIHDLQATLMHLGYNVPLSGIMDSVTEHAACAAKKSGKIEWADYFNTDKKATISWDTIKGIVDACTSDEMERRTLLLTVRIENFPSKDGVIVEFKPTYVGIGEFSAVTWKEVSDMPFSMSCDPNVAIPAMLRLLRRNAKYFKMHCPLHSLTPEILYLMHNQGAHGGVRYLRTGYLGAPHQSHLALVTFESARRQYQEG